MTSGGGVVLLTENGVSTAGTAVMMSPAMTPQMKVAALYLSVSLGCVEAVMGTERPGSGRHTKLANLIDHINRVVDVYRLEAFPIEDMRNACRLIDMVNEQLNLMYSEVT